MKTKKLTIITALITTLLIGSYFVAANYGFFGGGTNASSVPEDTMTRGLVGYWEFEEGTGQTAYDGSDSSNDGQLGSTASSDDNDPAWTGEGKNGGGMEFDGVDDYVDCGSGSSLEFGIKSFTIESWFKTSNLEHNTIIGNNPDSSLGFYISIYNGQVYYYNYAAAKSITTLSDNWNDGLWHHLILIRNGIAGNAVYIDGQSQVLLANTDDLNDLNDAGQILKIGEWYASSRHFNGSIDSVRIYNRALSADEVRYHYNRGGPVGYWNFDEGSGTTAFDGTGNNNDGTLKSSGLDFDGVDDYVDVGNDVSLQITGNLTIEAWIKGTGTAVSRIVSKDDIATNRNYLLQQEITTGTARFGIFKSDTFYSSGSSSVAINDGNWHHVVGVNDGTNLIIYVDGLSSNSSANGGTIDNDTTNLWIGRASNSSEPFNGYINEVRIYNTALSAEEIARQYNGDFSQDPTGNLVLLQHFEEGMACNANDEVGCLTDDSSGGVNDGTLKSFDNLTTWDNGTDGWISEVKKPEWRWVDGKYKTAGEFNGWDDYVDCGNDVKYTSGVTYEAWINPDTIQDDDHIIRKNKDTLRLKEDGKLEFTIDGTDWGGHLSTNSINVGEWTSIVATFDDTSDNLRYYINGKLDSSLSYSANISSSGPGSYPLYIGENSYSGQQGNHLFHGSIDDVRIYNYARTADEIRLDYNAGVATHLGPSGKTCSEDPAGCMDYGLVGSWGMDEGTGTTAYDGSDNSNDGSLTNGPKWTADSFPLAGGGGSLSFDGVDDYVDCGNDSSLNPTDAITIEAWVKKNGSSTNAYPKIIWKGGNDQWQIHSGANNDFTFNLNIAGSFRQLTANPVFELNKFVFITAIFDGTNRKLYKNGNEIASNSEYSGSIGTTALNLRIGNSEGAQVYNGLIDDVRIYNRALSAEEVRYHYNKGGPVAEWGFDEGSGTTAFDGTENNNDGTRTAGSTSGTVDSGSTITLVDDALTQADDYWNDWTVKIVTTTDSLAPQGETATVTDFVAGTDTLSFTALTAAVGAGDTYKLYYGNENGPTWTTGKYGSAMSFDGEDDYVNCGNDDSLDITVATVSMWFNANVTGDSLMGRGFDKWRMYGNPMHIYNNRDGAYSNWTTNWSYSMNIWYHLVWVNSGSNEYLYINGELKDSRAVSGVLSSTTDLILGAYSTINDFFNGTIDSVRIYDYARTADEIRLDYQAGVATHLGPSGKTCSEDPAGCVDYGLVGSWGMDEGTGTTAYDSSDNSNDGTLGGGPKWTADSSPLAGGGGSLKFDGVDDYVDCGNDSSLDITDAITIEAWVKTKSTTSANGQIIAGKYYNSFMYIVSTGELSWYIMNSSDVWNQLITTQKITTDWTHIVATYTSAGSSNRIVYINGVFSKSDSGQTGNIKSVATPVSIGSSSTNPTERPFNGSIDNVRIYNRALSAEEVRYHYNKGGPVAEWKFDEGSGQTAYDESWNNNDGTLTNFGTTDTGTAESGGDNTLTDSDKTWSTDQWADGTITTTGGTGSGQSRTVSLNTGTVITVSSNWTTNPDATTTYSLVQAPSFTAGKYGSAIQFDGVDDYVNAGNDASLDITGAITMEAWVKPNTQTANYRTIVGKTKTLNSELYEIRTSTYTSDITNIQFRVGNGIEASVAASLNNGIYAFVTGVYDGSKIKIYKNGILVKESTYTSGIASMLDINLEIGKLVGHGNHFNGSIDDVRIYNYARTPLQIQQDYNAGVATHFR